jgi:hypothetical protein
LQRAKGIAQSDLLVEMVMIVMTVMIVPVKQRKTRFNGINYDR